MDVATSSTASSNDERGSGRFVSSGSELQSLALVRRL